MGLCISRLPALCLAPDPYHDLRSRPRVLTLNLYLPAVAPNLYLPALATSLYHPALAPNLCLPTLVPKLYLPTLIAAMAPNLYLPVQEKILLLVLSLPLLRYHHFY